MPPPQLFVFAGPNGSGKSTVSNSLVASGTPIFDGDAEFLKLKKVFYDLDDNTIRLSINDTHFPDWKDQTIANGIDATFETNFRSDDVIRSVEQFMSLGYESRLIFLGLDSVEASIGRVKLRVANGGHAVSLEDITNNYNQSLINLNLFYNKFTSVHLYQNFQAPDEPMILTPLSTVENNKIIEQADKLPDWAIQFLKNIKP